MYLYVIAVVLFALLGFTYQVRAFVDATAVAILLPTVVLVVLIIAACIKKSKQGEFHDLPKEDLETCSFAMAIPGINILLIALTGVLDLTTLSILFPSLVLLALVFEAAKRKGPTIASFFRTPQIFNHVFGLIFAVFSLIAINCTLKWTVFPQNTDPSILAAISFSGNILLAVMLTAAVTFGSRIISSLFYSKGQSIVTNAIFHTALLSVYLLYFFPICFLFIAHDSSVDQFLALRDVYRVCIAMGTIPISFMGFAIAFHGAKFATVSTRES